MRIGSDGASTPVGVLGFLEPQESVSASFPTIQALSSDTVDGPGYAGAPIVRSAATVQIRDDGSVLLPVEAVRVLKRGMSGRIQVTVEGNRVVLKAVG